MAQRAKVLSLGGVLLFSTECGTSGSADPGGAAGATGDAGSAGSGIANDSGGSAGNNATAGNAGVAGGGTAGSSGSAGNGTAGGGGSSGVGGSAGLGTAGTSPDAGTAPDSGTGGPKYDGAIFYVTRGDGTLFAFQEGTWEQVGMWTGLPITDAIRGIDADPVAGVLYFTHGGAGPNSNGAPTTTGSLGAWSLYTNRLVYDVKLTHGVDQPSYGLGVVYVPSGEYTNDRNWYYYHAADGTLIGTEAGGMNPHDTIWKNSHRYYGGTQDTYLYVLGLAISKVGPSPAPKVGVRPFTVNGNETRAYITWSGFRGFSVGDLTTGNIIKTVNFGSAANCPIVPSHGMSLSPDNTEVYVLDTCMDQIKAYTATDDPQLIAAIPLVHKIQGGTETNCAWDCSKDGWIMHSRDGKYVYIGDSGDVVDTATHQMATYIAPLANCRHGFLEMDWSNGVITGTTTHVGLGY